MINLIPKEEKRKMERNFFYRLIVVYLLVFSFPILIGVAVMIPSYFLAHIKEDLVNKKLAAQKAEPVPILDQQTLEIIKNLKNKINTVENAENNKFIVSQKVINAIILKKMPVIKITNISYENTQSTSEDGLVAQNKKISIEGTAPSRPLLLLFRKGLEDSPTFKSVDLPISNFVKGSNIQFYLSLIPRTEGAVGTTSQ